MLIVLWSVFFACTEPTAKRGEVGISDQELVFGDIPIGSIARQSLTLQNRSAKDISVLSVSLVSGSTGAWSVGRTDELPVIAIDETTEIEVVFTPVLIELYDGLMQVRTSHEDFSNFEVSLSGTGVESVIDNDGDGFSPSDGDCNDNNRGIYPGAEEVCDGADTNCDGAIPEEEDDADFDGWMICEGDCNDGDNRVRPEATEICDDADTNCDGIIQDHLDEDGDGFSICEEDCDDLQPLVWPGKQEVCDGLDNDCDGGMDNIDQDGDGYTLCTTGGDCDDRNANAHPVLVDINAENDGDGSVETPFRDLDEAIANIDNVCRTIALLPGTYSVQMDWEDGPLYFVGAGNNAGAVTFELGVDEDEEQLTGRLFEVSNGAVLGFSNLTIRDGSGVGDGGAIRAVNANVEFYGAQLLNNTSTSDGGAIAVTAGTLVLEDTLVQGNISGDDGGAVLVSSGELIVNGSTFRNNRGTRGGAVYLESASATIDGATFDSNNAFELGGGLAMTAGGPLVLERSNIWRNASNLGGGGIALLDHSTDTSLLRNNLFQDNIAGTDGGALYMTGTVARALIGNNTLTGNDSDNGGAMYIDSTDADQLYLWSNLLLRNGGDFAIYNFPTNGASIAYNTAYASLGGAPFSYENEPSGGQSENQGGNHQRDPMVVDFSDDGNLNNDDFNFMPGSDEINSGPQAIEGPSWYGDWADIDGSRNDRGSTGGGGAE